MELNDEELSYAIFSHKTQKLEELVTINHQSETIRKLSKDWRKQKLPISIAIPYQTIIEKEIKVNHKTRNIKTIKMLKDEAKKHFLYPATKLYIDFYRHNQIHITAIAAKKSRINELLRPIINIIHPSHIDVDLYALARTVDQKYKTNHLLIMQQENQLYLIIYKNNTPVIKYSKTLEENTPEKIAQAANILLKIYNTKTSLLPISTVVAGHLAKKQNIQKIISSTLKIPCQLDSSYANHSEHLIHLGLAMRKYDAI
ncbi:MAG: pilus assembly protein PilM [Gammaproteobacteria bacterium]|nr:pilus assembly protein PilM [Gammaproteobacteria bacterium]